MAERIDVLSGPASVLYGQGALGGAINVILRQPNSERFEAQGEIGYGSQDSFHAAAGVGGRIGTMFSFRLDGSYRRSDGYVDRVQSKSTHCRARLFTRARRDREGAIRSASARSANSCGCLEPRSRRWERRSRMAAIRWN
ncbi:hypothetical protein [Sphingobium lactosutens]|uniref:hypothetical protein n=1 Tax=Sphingobium lactosutens TaxID=522773 RepID=UPI004038A50F